MMITSKGLRQQSLIFLHFFALFPLFIWSIRTNSLYLRRNLDLLIIYLTHITMKKFFSLAAIALFACAFTFVSCGEDEETTPSTPTNTNGGGQNGGTDVTGGAVTSVNDLVGTWSTNNFSCTFTTTQLTYKHVNDDRILYQGPYTLQNGIVSYTEEVDGQNYTNKYKVETYYDGAIMLMYRVYEDEGQQYEEMMDLFVKEGKSIPTSANLNGTWYMYEQQGRQPDTEEGKPICAAITIKGNKLELIICPWSRKFTGTYTYNQGELTFNIEHYYVNYNFEGEDRLNWVTLEGKWEELPLTDYNFNMDNPATFEFFVLGNKAYGTVGRPGIYEKQ